jgi:hypothetical protein
MERFEACEHAFDTRDRRGVIVGHDGELPTLLDAEGKRGGVKARSDEKEGDVENRNYKAKDRPLIR